MAKIMLVEDDNNLREIYEARLAAEGYDIVSARDGEEALTVAMKEKPDLIISDVMMPKISGFDMLDILRATEETKNTKVIMMTALSQAEDKERAEKLGADRYLVKSQVTLEDVAKVAREVLEGGSAGATPNAVPVAAEEPGASDSVVIMDDDPAVEETDADSTEQPVVLPPIIDASDPVTAVQTEQPQQSNAAPLEAVASQAPAAPNPVMVSPSSVMPASDSVGLGAITSAQPMTTPVVVVDDDQATSQPSTVIPVTPDPSTQQTTTPVSDPLVESTLTEEQIIAQQIKDSLNIGKSDTEMATPVDPVMNATPTPDITNDSVVQPPMETPRVSTESNAPSAGRSIEPINDVHAPGPDLVAMAAREEAMQAAVQNPLNNPVVVQPTVVHPDEASPQQAPMQNEDTPATTSDENLPKPVAPPEEHDENSVDPNSIAL